MSSFKDVLKVLVDCSPKPLTPDDLPLDGYSEVLGPMKLYNKQEFIDTFQEHPWVCIMRIIAMFNDTYKLEMTESELGETTKQFLQFAQHIRDEKVDFSSGKTGLGFSDLYQNKFCEHMKVTGEKMCLKMSFGDSMTFVGFQNSTLLSPDHEDMGHFMLLLRL